MLWTQCNALSSASRLDLLPPCAGAQQLVCDTPASLVAGYAEANRVSAALDAFYPTGASECCTPSVRAQLC